VTYRIGFLMDQVAGHITNYRNLRRVADTDPEIAASWHEISYHRPEAGFEQFHERYLRFVPTYVTGNLRAAWEIRVGLRQGPYDAVLSNARVGVFFGRSFARVPTMIDFDATPVQLDAMPSYGGRPDAEPVARLKWRLAHHMFHSAVLLQAWSSWAKQSAVDDYGVPAERVIVNPPGVDMDQWRPIDRTGRGGEATRVLFVGGDFVRKGGEQLLAWLRGAPSDVELHVVTREDVPARPNLFVHHGLEPNSAALVDLYDRADVFVLPSLGECFGIATVEAMAAGLPVVASDVGGTADIVDEGVNGYIVPAGDVRALAGALDGLIGDPARRAAMALRSRALAEERFDLDVNARKTLTHLKELAAGARRGR
jgi:glycosyltransferase involved in cell wall biosynthesis